MLYCWNCLKELYSLIIHQGIVYRTWTGYASIFQLSGITHSFRSVKLVLVIWTNWPRISFRFGKELQ